MKETAGSESSAQQREKRSPAQKSEEPDFGNALGIQGNDNPTSGGDSSNIHDDKNDVKSEEAKHEPMLVPINDTRPRGQSGGFWKYHCRYVLMHGCQNTVYQRGATCASCLASYTQIPV
jgi:hypothetical protein